MFRETLFYSLVYYGGQIKANIRLNQIAQEASWAKIKVAQLLDHPEYFCIGLGELELEKLVLRTETK